MTDEERKEAELFARQYPDNGELTVVLAARREGRYEGYVAASEAKRAEIENWKREVDGQANCQKNFSDLLKHERARSAKLITILVYILRFEGLPKKLRLKVERGVLEWENGQ